MLTLGPKSQRNFWNFILPISQGMYGLSPSSSNEPIAYTAHKFWKGEGEKQSSITLLACSISSALISASS
uniref:Uncharacterized protein n=1 Tax=Arundo donax TaxID=35708 RepID=A0A0A9AEJ5_ARUDO